MSTDPGSQDPAARADTGQALLNDVYNRLRRVAAGRMKKAPDERTLQATALVHEAWIKLAADDRPLPQTTEHMISLFARAMQQVVIDRWRQRQRDKHGSGERPKSLTGVAPPAERSYPNVEDDLEAVSLAMDELEQIDKRKVLAVRLTYFLGLTVDQAAEMLGVSSRTVERDSRAARAWIYNRLKADDDDDDDEAGTATR